MKQLSLLGIAVPMARSAATASASERNPGLKLMSFNVRYVNDIDGGNCRKNRRQAVIAAVESEQPDVIGFQEPCGEQAAFLCRELDDRYANVKPGGDYGVPHVSGHTP